ncbi:cytochrome c, partial [PVC group bacterium]|nr:cytochrome c [PVC group bacterium]
VFQAGRIGADNLEGSTARRIYWSDVGASKIPEVPELLALGKSIYGQRCAGCHGQNGLGNGSATAYMLTKPRDFSQGEFKLHTTMDFPTDEDLFSTITVGFPAYGMPSYAYLSERQRWALVYYVKQLGRQGFKWALAKSSAKEQFDIDLDTLTFSRPVKKEKHLLSCPISKPKGTIVFKSAHIQKKIMPSVL